MSTIAYDPTRNAVFHPGRADNFFQLGPISGDAALCVEMARLAYVKDEARLAGYLARANFEQALALGYATLGTQAFVATQKNGALSVVAFRGSEPEDPSDIFADADFALTDWCDAAGRGMGKVHEGFARLINQHQLLERLVAHIAGLPAGQRVLITGHSLGAALATLLASRLPAAELYSFGSPRVGNDAFAAAMGTRAIKRYVNCCDIVPRVPPREVLGYTHVGSLVYIDRHGKCVTAPGAATMLDDAAQAQLAFVRYALVRGTVYSRDLADHAPINYVSGVMGLRA